MGKDKAKKVAPPPPPPPVRSFEVTGSCPLSIACVLTSLKLLQSRYASPSCVRYYCPKGDAVSEILKAAKAKDCPPVLLVEGGTVCVGLRSCLAATSVSSGSHNDCFEHMQWLAFISSSLAPAVSKKDGAKIEAAVAKISDRLASTRTGRLTSCSPLSCADIYCVGTLLPVMGSLPCVSPMTCSPQLCSFLCGVPQDDRFARSFEEAKSYLAAGGEGEGKGKGGAGKGGIFSVVEAIFDDALYRAFPIAASLKISTFVAHTKDPKNGDFQCNNAMELFGKLPKSMGYKSPRDVAAALVKSIDGGGVIGKTEIAGPGFINVWISDDYVLREFRKMVDAPWSPEKVPSSVSSSSEEAPLTVVDFSSPNIAKDMHVGHLRSTIIGESVCRILEHTGHRTMRVNHVGDWGTQFGMLIQYLKEKYGDDPRIEDVDITDLTGFYKAAKVKFDEDTEFKKVSQLNVVKLQSGDPSCRRIWTLLCDISRAEFEKVYKRLGVTVEERGESFYNEMIPDCIDELRALSLIVPSEGAQVSSFVCVCVCVCVSLDFGKSSFSKRSLCLVRAHPSSSYPQTHPSLSAYSSPVSAAARPFSCRSQTAATATTRPT